MPASLVAETGHAMPLTGHSVIVGSDPQAHVPVRADLGLAARHYELRLLPDGGHQVVALEPMAPVLLNGQRVGNAELADGDVITAGALRLTYRAAPRPTFAAAVPKPAKAESGSPWTMLVVAWVLGTLACMLAAGLPWVVWLGVIAGTGAGVGWMIGAGARQSVRHASLVAATIAVTCLLVASLARHEHGMAEYRAEQSAAVIESLASVPDDESASRRPDGYVFDPSAAVDAPAPVSAPAIPMPAKPMMKPAPVPDAFSVAGLLWLLFNAKVLTGYGVIAAMASMVCSRVNKDDEEGGRPLRERLEFEKPKTGPR